MTEQKLNKIFDFLINYIISLNIGDNLMPPNIILSYINMEDDREAIKDIILMQFKLQEIGVLSHAMITFTKEKNMTFFDQLTLNDLNKMIKNEQYINIFERKCKIKKIKK